VAWHPDRRLDLPEWIRQGHSLGTIGRGAAWWIGDWVNYGNAKFGEKYARASRITGYDIQSLMNMAYVASRFHISRRRENLSWSHHAEVAAQSEENQERWLGVAADNRLSVRGLRDELRAWRARLKVPDIPAAVDEGSTPETAAAEQDAAVCPRCGFDLVDQAHESEPVRQAG
jgi:hypothetical protein